jgi:hypothetical protein
LQSKTKAKAISEKKSEKWYAPLAKARRALIEWAAHLLVVVGILLGIRAVEEIIHRLWQSNDRLLFGRLPLSYVFDAADLAVLIGFLSYGVFCVIAAYMEKH